MKKTLLIVGAGLAGLSAAWTAAEQGHQAILVSAQPSERAQSVMAEGGINAALDTKGEGDTPQQHEADTLRAACGLANPQAVHGLTQAAPQLVRQLDALGVQFNRTKQDDIDVRAFGGQKNKRTAFAQSDTGKQLVTAMIDAVRRWEVKKSVARLDHHVFETLLLDGNTCGGCVVRDTYTGEHMPIQADAVIMACGGMHGLFGDTTGSVSNTGEAVAELFRLGVPLANAEMIQYHPTTAKRGGRRLLISEAARGEGGRLYALRDGKPWYFMEERYPELGNLMPRDVTAREIWRVRQQTPVYLDMTHLSGEVFAHRLSGLREDCITYLGLDPKKQPIPVEPGIHYFMGGLRVDAQHRTSMRNLYAAGECCAQYHGANRLGGNSLLGAIYGGKIAAQTALAQTALAQTDGSAHTCQITQEGAQTPMQEQQILHRALLDGLGVVRTQESMERALHTVQSLSGNLALLGQAVLRSALARRESRGAQFRADYPETEQKYCAATVAHYQQGNLSITWGDVTI